MREMMPAEAEPKKLTVNSVSIFVERVKSKRREGELWYGTVHGTVTKRLKRQSHLVGVTKMSEDVIRIGRGYRKQ